MAPDCLSSPVLQNTALPDSENDTMNGFHAVQRDPSSWASALPASQGLYQNDFEKDACGVGFICHIKGEQSHKIVSDARQLLCAMTHRGATGADSRDGDGAGVMTGIPHLFFKREAERDIGAELPDPGQYAVGNVFFKPNDPVGLQKQQAVFSKIAADLGLRVLGWREVPTDGTILGPAAASKEPSILQPFVVLRSSYGDGNAPRGHPFDAKNFERQLYVLRKHATHSMFVIFSPYYQNRSLNTSDLSCMYKVPSLRDSTYAPCRPRISCTRANSPRHKCTITITISIMFYIVLISHLYTRVSLQIPSQVGTGHNR